MEVEFRSRFETESTLAKIAFALPRIELIVGLLGTEKPVAVVRWRFNRKKCVARQDQQILITRHEQVGVTALCQIEQRPIFWVAALDGTPDCRID
jgi:hypothetical protein